MSKESRITDVKSELELVRGEIKKAARNTSVNIDGHSLQRQAMETLQEREATLLWSLQELLQDGPFGNITIEGRNDYRYYTRNQSS